MAVHLSKSIRLKLIILITASFFAAEIAVGFYARSLALVADAFHYLNDLIGFVIALVALELAESAQTPPRWLSFGWQRAQVIGAFFNGIFLFALGTSTALQSIEKFIHMHNDVTHPKFVLIVGSVGLVLNICSILFMHEHKTDDIHSTAGQPYGEDSETNSGEMATPTKSKYELGSLGIMLHFIGDALNNIGVIISALVIWLTRYDARYYADPVVSITIALMILMSSAPLALSSGRILIQSIPTNVNLGDVEAHLKAVPGVIAIDELRIWRLNERTNIGSVHVVLGGHINISQLLGAMEVIRRRFHAFGVHSVTIQPEILQIPGVNERQGMGEDKEGDKNGNIVVQEEYVE